MDIQNLTLRQLKLIAELFPSETPAPVGPAAGLVGQIGKFNEKERSEKPSDVLIGKLVIVRSYASGVFFGKLAFLDGETAIIEGSARLWKWKAESGVALSGLAKYGINRSESKIDTIIESHYVTGVCEVIPCGQPWESFYEQ